MRTPTSPHRGSLLVEMLVTITILTILLGCGAVLLHILLRLDGVGRDTLDVATDQTRLGETWRADVHAATRTPAPLIASDHLTLMLPDAQRVDYTIRPHDFLREVRQGDKLRQRELYRRPPRSSARFEATTEANRPILSLVITPAATASPPARTDAEVGRLARWAGRIP